MPTTPLTKIGNIYFKREDLNTTGSAKDRALAHQVKNIKTLRLSSAVISSTGNAAISALHFCQKHHINLTIFLSPKINPKKLSIIRKKTDNIIFSNKPISDAFKYAQKHHSYNLRQSTDPTALTGYRQIGREIQKQLPPATSIFIPVGSGTTLLGLSQSLSPSTKIFAVQPAGHCPIASLFDQSFTPEKQTSASALLAKSLPLKKHVIKAIKNSSGSGLVVQEENMVAQQKYLTLNHISSSAEGALALAGYQKAIKKNLNVGKYPIILLTGARR